MRTDETININLDEFIFNALDKYHKSIKNEPLIPDVRNILFNTNTNIIIGTYDHLRSPFSSRLITGDARFSALATILNMKCISLILDLTMAPIDCYHKTARGDRIGLFVFSKKLAFLDRIILNPHNYIPFNNTEININIGIPEIKKYFYDPIISYLLKNHKYNKQKVLFITEELTQRALQIVEIYNSVSKLEYKNIGGYLLSVREKLWQKLNFDEHCDNIEQILISTMYKRIAHALLLFKGKSWFKSFLFNANMHNLPLFKYLDKNGHNSGVIYCGDKPEIFVVVHPVTKKFIREIKGWEQICEMIVKCQSFPTTIILYLLFHIVAGYPHFGNSHRMNEYLCKIINVPQNENIDLTNDYTNSFPIDEISVPMGVSSKVQKNVTVDLIFHGFTNYKIICNDVIRNGKMFGNYTFGYDLPKQYE